MLQTLYLTKFGIPVALEAFIASKEVNLPGYLVASIL